MPTSGPFDAPISIVEWSDYSCGYCGRLQETLARLERLYPGQLRRIHRALPLDEERTVALELARVADAQGRFLPVHAKLFALHGRVDRVGAELLGREFGLDVMRLREALDAGVYRAAIAADVRDAARLGVTGTPTLFINGRRIPGSQRLNVYVEIIDQELLRARVAAAIAPFGALNRFKTDGKVGTPASEPIDAPSPSDLEPTATYRVGLGLPGQQQGPEDAPVTIVIWSDFQCPYCARQARVLADVRARYGDRVRISVRPMVLAGHHGAMLAAEAAAAAAAQGKFWAFHDHVFSNFGRLRRHDLEAFAEAAQIDLAAFRAALNDHRYRDAVVAETAAAEAIGVDGTPTMFINGQPIVGARNSAAMRTTIDAHLERATQAMARGVAQGDLYPLAMDGAIGDERADPSMIPEYSVGRLALRAEPLGRAVIAACRRRDETRAAMLAAGLRGKSRHRASAVCTAQGVDLPPKDE